MLLGEELPQAKCMIYQNINDVFAKVCEDMKYPSPSYGFYCPEACKYGELVIYSISILLCVHSVVSLWK